MADAEPDGIVRWRATIYYRTDHGVVPTVLNLSELYELHDEVEHGPHWDTIERIEVVRVDVDDPLTVEESFEL